MSLTKEEHEGCKQGICPGCKKVMVRLDVKADPKQGELYCSGCHFSYPFNPQRAAKL